MAERQRSAGDYKKAADNLTRAICINRKNGKNRDNAMVYLTRAFCLLELDEFEKAKSDMGRAIALDPAINRLLSGIGFPYKNLKANHADMLTLQQALRPKSTTAKHYLTRAAMYERLGMLDQAEKALSSFIKVAPGDTIALLNRAKIRYELDRLPEAHLDANKAIELKPAVLAAYLIRLKILRAMGQYEKAQRDRLKACELGLMNLPTAEESSVAEIKKEICILDKSIKTSPNNWVAYIARARRFCDLGSFAQSTRDYSQALRLNSKLARAYNCRGNNRIQMGQFDDAIKDFSMAVSINPRFADAFNNRAIAYINEGELAAALQDENKAIRLDPYLAMAFSNRANIFARQLEYQAALSDCARAIALEPKSGEAYLTRATCHRAMGRIDLADQDMSKAIQLEPNLVPPNESSIMTVKEKAQLLSCINLLSKQVEKGNDGGAALLLRAYCRQRLGNFSQALRDATQAMLLSPKSARALNFRAFIYNQMNRPGDAVKDADRALAFDSKNAESYNIRAVANLRLHKVEAALADSTKALQLNPHLAAAHSVRAETYVSLKQYQKALQEINTALKKHILSANYYYQRAVINRKIGRVTDSSRDIDRGIELNPSFVPAYSARANTSIAMGDYEMATQDFQQINKILTSNNRKSEIPLLEQASFDKIVKDYTQIIRLAPNDAAGYYNRGFLYLAIGNNEAAVGDLSKFLALTSSDRSSASFATIACSFAMRKLGLHNDAEKLLNRLPEHSGEILWPSPIVDFLGGHRSMDSLLACAIDVDKLTSAKYYLGMDLLLHLKTKEAREQLEWVRDHGNPEMDEYYLAAFELKRLNQPKHY